MGPFSNTGHITATGATLNLDGSYNYGNATIWTNTGTISATGSTVNVAGDETVAQIGTLTHDATDTLNYTFGTLDNTGGTLGAATAALIGVHFNGAEIEGGMLDAAGLGLAFNGSGANTLDNVALINDFTLNGGLVNFTGTTAAYADGTETAPGTIRVNAGLVSFTGTGPFTLANHVILDGGTITWTAAGLALATNAAGNVIEGTGNIYDNQIGTAPDALTNAGTILADVQGEALNLSPTSLTNDGLLRVTDQSTLYVERSLGRSWTNAATGTISGDVNTLLYLSGPFNNAGTITAQGGTLTLDGTTNGSTPASWSNSGVISVFDETVTIAGNETVAQLGSINAVASQLNYVDGALDNTGHTLNGSSSLHGLQLQGATIDGGTIDQLALGLTFTGSIANVLHDVTLINDFAVNGGNVILDNSKVYGNAAATAAAGGRGL